MSLPIRTVAVLLGGLLLLASPPARADGKEAGQVLDAYSTALGYIYPPAGTVFEVTKKFLELTGYFGSTPDPVGDAIKLINERLDSLTQRMDAAEKQINAVQNDLFKTQNLARVRQLRNLQREIQSLAFTLAQKPTEQATKAKLANDARLIANEFLDDQDLWLWSDLATKSHTWNGKAIKAGDMIPPEFKPMPTLEYYATTLAAWMAACDYAANGNAAWVKTTFGPDLQRHIDFLGTRPNWNDQKDAPQTLPEQIKSRINAEYVPEKYPDKGTCHINEFTRDDFAREIRYVEDLQYQAHANNELCNVPQGLWNRATAREEELENQYGVSLTDALAHKLTLLRDRGSIREARPIWETTPLISPNAKAPQAPEPIYCVDPAGQLKWFRHDGAGDGTYAWAQDKVLGQGFGDYTNVFADTGGVIYAIAPDHRMFWWKHLGWFDGSTKFAEGSGHQIGEGWAAKQVFSNGQGIIYLVNDKGDLEWRNYLGYQYGGGYDKWVGPEVVAHGWGDYKYIIPAGEGVIYTVSKDGQLVWHKHLAWEANWRPVSWFDPDAEEETPSTVFVVNPQKPIKHTGRSRLRDVWAPPVTIRSNWQDYQQPFSSGDGVLYAVAPNYDLHWFKHDNYLVGENPRITPGGPGQKPIRHTGSLIQFKGPTKVGNGWQDKFLFGTFEPPFVGPK